MMRWRHSSFKIKLLFLSFYFVFFVFCFKVSLLFKNPAEAANVFLKTQQHHNIITKFYSQAPK